MGAFFGNNKPPENQQLPENQQPVGKVKTFCYRAKVNCTLAGKYYNAGEIITSLKKVEAPHLEPVEKN